MRPERHRDLSDQEIHALAERLAERALDPLNIWSASEIGTFKQRLQWAVELGWITEHDAERLLRYGVA